jgi:hypothetical protein
MIQNYIKGISKKDAEILIKRSSDGLITYSNNDIIKNCIKYELFEYLPRNEKGQCIYNGNLYTRELKTKLPENFYVMGSLDVSYNEIIGGKLPKGLKIHIDLECNSTGIYELPKDLWVGNNLYIEDTFIEEIPETIYVGGIIYIRNIYNLDRNKIPEKFKTYE